MDNWPQWLFAALLAVRFVNACGSAARTSDMPQATVATVFAIVGFEVWVLWMGGFWA